MTGTFTSAEQAATDRLERPYRQRVYHLMSTDEGYASEIYELPGKARDYVGGWVAGSPVHAVSAEDLRLRAGCSIHLRDRGDHFAGGTVGNGCSSRLGDAAYATSEVTIHADRIVSWDQGFTATDKPAWGPERGGYEFMKRSPAAP